MFQLIFIAISLAYLLFMQKLTINALEGRRYNRDKMLAANKQYFDAIFNVNPKPEDEN
jgi:hypothetical protein